MWLACLPLLLALANEKRLKHAFLLGYVCGAFFFAGSCYWFITVMEFYGHLTPVLAVLALILFVIIDATFFGGFGLAMGWAARRSPGWALAASPFLWMAMELARTYLITGFRWNLLGYAVQASGVRQIATVTGVYGLSFLAMATSALMAWVLLSPRRARAGLALAGWLVAAASCPVEIGSASRDRGQGIGRFWSSRTCPWMMRSWRLGCRGEIPRNFSGSCSSAFPALEESLPDVAPGFSPAPNACWRKPRCFEQLRSAGLKPGATVGVVRFSHRARATNPKSKIANPKSSGQSAAAGLGGKPRAVLLHPRPDFSQCHGKHGAADARHRDREYDYSRWMRRENPSPTAPSRWILKAAKSPGMIKFIWCPLASTCRGGRCRGWSTRLRPK